MHESRRGQGPYLHQISVSAGGLPKLPVPEARITVDGVEGDAHRNLKLHGGPARAVCLYSLDRIEALRAEGHPIQPGFAGENFTIAGLDWPHLAPGDRVTVGDVELEITSYTDPCKLNCEWFADGRYERIGQAQYPGWSRLYARVLREGRVRTGDPVRIEQPGR